MDQYHFKFRPTGSFTQRIETVEFCLKPQCKLESLRHRIITVNGSQCAHCWGSDSDFNIRGLISLPSPTQWATPPRLEPKGSLCGLLYRQNPDPGNVRKEDAEKEGKTANRSGSSKHTRPRLRSGPWSCGLEGSFPALSGINLYDDSIAPR